MNLIAAVDRNWGIGLKGQLLVRIPNDQKQFREETMGKVVVYGRRTLGTFPQGIPLQGRRNIIFSRNREFGVKGAAVVHSPEELWRELQGVPSEDVFCIGGESVYRLLLPFCDRAHITRIDHVYEADSWLPNLDRDPEWVVTAQGEEQTYFDIAYTFLQYERRRM